MTKLQYRRAQLTLPPFMLEAALWKVRLAEDARNTRDSARVVPADLADRHWRDARKRKQLGET